MSSPHGHGCDYAVYWPSAMTTATPSHHALVAGWLVTTELDVAEQRLSAPVAAERVYQKLSHRLAGLITRVGCEALLTRAVHLSGGLPLVDEAHSPRRADGLPPRVFHTRESAGPTQACEVAILGSLIALLVSFIGEELTFRILREVWPEVPMVQPVQPIHSNGTGNVEMTN